MIGRIVCGNGSDQIVAGINSHFSFGRLDMPVGHRAIRSVFASSIPRTRQCRTCPETIVYPERDRLDALFDGRLIGPT